MNTRIYPFVAAVMLMTFSSGCSGMRNFLFGRGARCGLCSTTPTAPSYVPAPTATTPYQQPYTSPPAPTAPYPPQQPAYQTPPPPSAPCQSAPCQSAPYQPAPCQSAPNPYSAPAYPAAQPRPGLINRALRSLTCGNWFGRPAPAAPAPPAPCQSCYSVPCAPHCGAYESCPDCMSGSLYGDGYHGEGGVVVDPYMQGQEIVGEPTVIEPDDFSARRYDTDGSRIIWEDPATEL